MVDQQKVLDQLNRILKSRSFQNSEKLRRFLEYIVIEDIEGRSHSIKSYSIGTKALGRPSDFDLTNDGVVRTTANRLRSTLEKYYMTEGASDPLRISLPLGRYIPEYAEASGPLPSPSRDEDDNGSEAPHYSSVGLTSNSSVPRPFRRFLIYVAVAIPLFAVAAYGGLQMIRPHPDAVWRPPTILILATEPLTDDQRAILFARSLPARLSDAMTFYDINSIVRTQDLPEAQNYAGRLPENQSAYVITSEIDSNATGLVLYWQLVDARTGAVLWSSQISERVENRLVDIMVHELVSENAVIRSAERRKLPLDPIAGYVCVTHSLNEMAPFTDAKRDWMAKCLSATVAMSPDYAQAWALLALVRVEDSITAANIGDREASTAFLQDAWNNLQSAERLAPGSWFTLRAKIALEFQTEDFANFQSSASKALARLPVNARERIAIGERLFALGEYEEAIAIIENTISWMTVPEPSDYLFLAADLYRRGKDHDALKILQDQPILESAFYWSLLIAVSGNLDDAATAEAAMQSLGDIQEATSSILEKDLRNRLFRNEFIEKIRNDFDRVAEVYFSKGEAVASPALKIR